MTELMTQEQAIKLLADLENRTTSLKKLKGEYTQIADCKTFDQAIKLVEALTQEVVATEETAIEEPVNLREQVKTEVLHLLEENAKSTFKIAGLIGGVKEDFDKSDEFLAWCKAELGLAKASVYKYLKINKVFNGKKEFECVAMRVLSELSSYKHLDKIIDDAESLALEGKLDSKACLALIDAHEEKINPKPAPKPAEAPTPSTQPLTDIPEQVEEEDEDEDDIPFDVDSVILPTASKPVEQQKADSDETQEPSTSEIDALTKQIEALTQQLAEANKTIAEMSKTSKRDTKVASAPMLPQFKNACLYARLGLGQVESRDKKVVKKAYRELVSLGYGEGHEAFSSIKEAVESLTK